jgi:hypothetical protein
MPEREDYSGTGSSYYDRFRKFILDFQGEVTGVPGLNVSNNREVNQYGIHAKCMGFSWNDFYNAISEELGFKEGANEEVREKFFALTTSQKMEAYRIFLINAFFTHLWEIIPPTKG